MENVKDFVLAALPWVVMGIALAVAAVAVSRRRKTNGKPAKETYMGEGMALGMLFGVAIGSTDGVELSTGLSMGLMLGMVVGLCIEKKGKKDGAEDEAQKPDKEA